MKNSTYKIFAFCIIGMAMIILVSLFFSVKLASPASSEDRLKRKQDRIAEDTIKDMNQRTKDWERHKAAQEGKSYILFWSCNRGCPKVRLSEKETFQIGDRKPCPTCDMGTAYVIKEE